MSTYPNLGFHPNVGRVLPKNNYFVIRFGSLHHVAQLILSDWQYFNTNVIKCAFKYMCV